MSAETRHPCIRCGKPKAFFAGEYCCECHNAAVLHRRAERKAQLAAMPRCEVEGCTRRGNRIAAGVALLCGGHVKSAQTAWVRSPGAAMSMFAPVSWTRDGILSLAKVRS